MPLTEDQIAHLDQIYGGQSSTTLSSGDIAKLDQIYGGNASTPDIGKVKTAFDQGMQGATFGFADEASDRLGALFATHGLPGVIQPNGLSYTDNLSVARGQSKDELGQEFDQHPAISIGSQIAGGLLTGGAGATTKTGATLGNLLRSGGTIGRIGKGAVAGALSGGLAGAGSADEGNRLQGAGIGAVIGGPLGAAIPAIAGTYGALKDAAQPFYESGRENIIGKFLAKQATDPAAVVASAVPTYVPGSVPTIGEASGDLGLLGLQRGVRNADPAGTFAQRESLNNTARQQLLDSISGTPEDIQNAQTARGSATNALYETAKQAVIPNNDELSTLLQRPSMKSATGIAQRLAAEQGDPIKFGKDFPASTTTSSILDANGNPVTVNNPAQNSSWSGKGLHYMKMALDNMINSPQTSGIGKTELGAIVNTKNDFLSAVEKQIPEYNQARTTYRDMSQPINQMEALQDIRARSNGTIPDPSTGQDVLSQPKISRIFDKQRGDLMKVLSPEQFRGLEGVVKDLDRSQASNSSMVRSAGSDTAQNLATKNIVSGLIGNTIADSSIGQTATRPLAWLYKLPEEKIKSMLVDALLDPQKAKSLMQTAMPSRAGNVLSKTPLSSAANKPLIINVSARDKK